MKYKRLTTEELQALEKEFVNYLSSAQITAGDWEKMKKNELQKAEELIDVFSDMVYENVVNKIKYLEFRDEKSLNIFHFTGESVLMIGLRVKENSSVNLLENDVLNQWNGIDSVNIIKSEKKYDKEKGLIIFELLKNGCLITDERLFNLLKGMV